MNNAPGFLTDRSTRDPEVLQERIDYLFSERKATNIQLAQALIEKAIQKLDYEQIKDPNFQHTTQWRGIKTMFRGTEFSVFANLAQLYKSLDSHVRCSVRGKLELTLSSGMSNYFDLVLFGDTLDEPFVVTNYNAAIVIANEEPCEI